MRDIPFRTRQQIINTNNFVAHLQESFTQMRTNKTGPTSHNNCFHNRIVYHSALILQNIGLYLRSNQNVVYTDLTASMIQQNQSFDGIIQTFDCEGVYRKNDC